MQAKYKESLLPPLWILVLGLVALSVWLISELREIVILIVISFAISYLIEPLLRLLEKFKIRRAVGFFVVAGVAAIILCLLIVTVLPVLQRELLQLIDNFPQYIHTASVKLQPYIQKFQGLLGAEAAEDSNGSLTKIVSDYAPKLFIGLQSTLLQGYSITLTIINAALLPFMVFYISMNFSGYRSFFVSLFPNQLESKVSEILTEIDGNVSRFVRGQLIVSFILFVMYTIGLRIVNVELWFLLGVIAGFGNLIPYLGTIVGILLATVMALISFGDFQHVLYVWGVFAIVQFLEGTFITPKVLGENVGLSPLAVIIAIFVGGKLFGLLGIFLAVPGAAIFKVLSKHFHTWIISKV